MILIMTDIKVSAAGSSQSCKAECFIRTALFGGFVRLLVGGLMG